MVVGGGGLSPVLACWHAVVLSWRRAGRWCCRGRAGRWCCRERGFGGFLGCVVVVAGGHLLVDGGELFAGEGEEVGVLEGLAEVLLGVGQFGLPLGKLALAAGGVAAEGGDAGFEAGDDAVVGGGEVGGRSEERRVGKERSSRSWSCTHNITERK